MSVRWFRFQKSRCCPTWVTRHLESFLERPGFSGGVPECIFLNLRIDIWLSTYIYIYKPVLPGKLDAWKLWIPFQWRFGKWYWLYTLMCLRWFFTASTIVNHYETTIWDMFKHFFPSISTANPTICVYSNREFFEFTHWRMWIFKTLRAGLQLELESLRVGWLANWETTWGLSSSQEYHM